jgi:hypothetical protein
MRSLLVVLSAAVTAGLVVFFSFDAVSAIGLMGGSVYIPVGVFVAFIAALTLAASALALTYRHLLMASDRRLLQGLSDRIAQLEARAPSV